MKALKNVSEDSNMCDRLPLIHHYLETTLKTPLSLNMFTDSMKLFDFLTRYYQTHKKRFMVEVPSVREAYNLHEISTVAFDPGEDSPADGLTRPVYFDSLWKLLTRSKDNTFVS